VLPQKQRQAVEAAALSWLPALLLLLSLGCGLPAVARLGCSAA